MRANHPFESLKWTNYFTETLAHTACELKALRCKQPYSRLCNTSKRDNIMKAVVADTLGPYQNFEIRDITLPPLKFGELQIRVATVGVGFVDALLVQGKYQVKPPTPFIPGTDFVGQITAVEQEVIGYQVGDWVCGQTFGGAFAEYLQLESSNLLKLPPHLAPANAAGVYINYQTAVYALRQKAQLQKGESVLVLGSSGGVGTATIQVAKAMGATVIAAASSQDKRDYSVELGADYSIDYSKPAKEWREDLKHVTQGNGVDVIIDPVGSDSFDPAFRSLAWGGRLIVIGFAGGTIPSLPANLPLLKGADLRGADFRQFTMREPQNLSANTSLLEAWLADQTIIPPQGKEFEFEDFALALDAATNRDIGGKVVLKVAP
jgi:NADPH2:quinone reductase